MVYKLLFVLMLKKLTYIFSRFKQEYVTKEEGLIHSFYLEGSLADPRGRKGSLCFRFDIQILRNKVAPGVDAPPPIYEVGASLQKILDPPLGAQILL